MADAFADRFAAVRRALGPLVPGADPHGRLLRDWGLTDDAGCCPPPASVPGAGPADVAAPFAACPDRVMPSASRSLLAAGPDVSALRDAITSLNREYRAPL